ncbi:unnamed protein product [Rotaria socialis]
MNRFNIRTVNGSRHNGLLEHRYIKIQNRAAAALGALDEDGESLELIAHLHRLSIEQIKKDLYGEPSDIKNGFDIRSSNKLEETLKTCLKEINKRRTKNLNQQKSENSSIDSDFEFVSSPVVLRKAASNNSTKVFLPENFQHDQLNLTSKLRNFTNSDRMIDD